METPDPKLEYAPDTLHLHLGLVRRAADRDIGKRQDVFTYEIRLAEKLLAEKGMAPLSVEVCIPSSGLAGELHRDPRELHRVLWEAVERKLGAALVAMADDGRPPKPREATPGQHLSKYVTVTKKGSNPLSILLDRLEKQFHETDAKNPESISAAIPAACEMLEHWNNATVVTLEDGAEHLLDQLLATGLYGMDREEVCIRLICEGLERRMDPIVLELEDEDA